MSIKEDDDVFEVEYVFPYNCLKLNISKCLICSNFPCNLFGETDFEIDLKNLVKEHRNPTKVKEEKNEDRCANCNKRLKHGHLVVNKHCDKLIYICQKCWDDDNLDIVRLN